MTHPNGWAVGMTVWAASRNDLPPEENIITKIGRRWISFKSTKIGRESRFDAETLVIDGGQYSSPGKVYPSLDEYHERSECGRLWTEYRRKLPWRPPAEMTCERIKQLIEELG